MDYSFQSSLVFSSSREEFFTRDPQIHKHPEIEIREVSELRLKKVFIFLSEFGISFQSKAWKQSIALLAVFVILSLMKVTDIFIPRFSSCSSQNIIYNYHHF